VAYSTSVHSASEAFATMRYKLMFYLLTYLLNKIFNDTKHRAASLRQLNFLHIQSSLDVGPLQ